MAEINPGGVQASSGDILALADNGSLPNLSSVAIARYGTNKTPGALLLGRFEAEVTWTDPMGNQGQASALSLSDNTLAFWFFDDRNIELVLKMLDPGASVDHFWMYYGALTNIAFEVRLTDTETGVVKIYSNAPGEFGSRSDTRAFPR